MIRNLEPVNALHRLIRSLFAAAILAAPMTQASAEEATHHFSIVRPAQPVVVGQPVEFEITARREDNKRSRIDHDVLVQITTGLGAKPQTLTQETALDGGQGRATITFGDVGPTIVQVTDKNNPNLMNSISVSVLPQPRKREVRQ